MRRVGKLMYEWVGFDHLPTLLEQLAQDETNGGCGGGQGWQGWQGWLGGQGSSQPATWSVDQRSKQWLAGAAAGC